MKELPTPTLSDEHISSADVIIAMSRLERHRFYVYNQTAKFCEEQMHKCYRKGYYIMAASFAAEGQRASDYAYMLYNRTYCYLKTRYDDERKGPKKRKNEDG